MTSDGVLGSRLEGQQSPDARRGQSHRELQIVRRRADRMLVVTHYRPQLADLLEHVRVGFDGCWLRGSKA
jgi:hypothetical protein